MKMISTSLISITSLFMASYCFAMNHSGTAPVSGFARAFLFDNAISNATVTVLETGQKLKTNANGQFGPIDYPIGKPITLILEKWGYKTTQTGTVIVPREGLTGPYHNITFQVPTSESFFLLATIIGAKLDDNSCHVATTITAYQKTLLDVPQGEAGAEITLSINTHERPFYFDIFKGRFFKGQTNPFTKGLTQTTDDGGVAFFNLPPSDKPYTISAVKPGVKFTEAQFLCRKGMFINISPPRGPMVQK